MRSILACAACRRLKIKCVHTGKPPCRACQRGSRESSCVLALIGTPPASSPTTPKKRRRTTRAIEAVHPASDQTSQPAAAVVGHDALAHLADLATLSDRPELLGTETAPAEAPVTTAAATAGQTEGPLSHVPRPSPCRTAPSPASTTPKNLMVQAGWVVIHKFPEFAFIHSPSFFAHIQDDTFDHVQMCAVLALAGRFVPGLVQLHGGEPAGRTGEVYAEYVRAQLSWQVLEVPSINTVQCLLLLAMYEWGACLGFRTWMYLGMAIRMSQTLKIRTHDGEGLDAATPAEREVRKRTVWSCFLIDRLMSCGKDRSMAFDLKDMQLPLPESDNEFMYASTEPDVNLGQRLSVLPTCLDINHQFTILLQGIDIWTAVSKWTTNGGRKVAHGSADCPWKSTSAWHHIIHRLEDWRSLQDERTMWYSPARLMAHIRGGYAEAFVFINLIYYLCLAYLHREFMPFMPLRVDKPQGPIDPPLYPEEAPPGWWERSSRTLHEAADFITDMLKQLHDAGLALRTPFVGFCAFTSASIHCVVHIFPHMNPGRSLDAGQKLALDMAYLRNFQTFWAMGRTWVETTEEMDRLYRHAAANREQFQTATRYDFVALEMRQYEYGDIQTTTTPTNPTTTPIAHMRGTQEALGPTPAASVHRRPASPQTTPMTSVVDSVSDTSPSIWHIRPVGPPPPAHSAAEAAVQDPALAAPTTASLLSQLDHIDEDFWRRLDMSIMGDGPSLFREL